MGGKLNKVSVLIKASFQLNTQTHAFKLIMLVEEDKYVVSLAPISNHQTFQRQNTKFIY